MEELHDACGVAAVYIKPESKDNDKAVFYLYKLLLNLQHRGQAKTTRAMRSLLKGIMEGCGNGSLSALTATWQIMLS